MARRYACEGVNLMKHRGANVIGAVFIVAFTVLSAGVPATGTRAATGIAGGAAVSGRWTAQASGTQQQLFSVSFFAVNRCKAVGAAGTLVYTKNGGVTWRPQSNPLTGSSTILYRIACVAPSTCYAIGRPNTMIVTHNGGVTWTTRRIPLPRSTGQLTSASCVSSQEGDLRGRPALCRLGLLDLACISASICYVAGTYSGSVPDSRVPGGLSPAIYLTTNGGSTWTAQRIPATAPCTGDCGGARVTYPLEWISCAGGLVCRAGGSIYMSSHTGYATLTIQTSKPGAAWTAVNNSWYWAVPDSAVCPTASRCYGVWTTSPFDLAGNGIFLSTDGGRQWNSQSSGSSKMRNAITCPGPSTCYSAGMAGTITASMNGGPFLAQPSGTSRDLYGIACAGPNTCFAVGTRGTIVARSLR